MSWEVEFGADYDVPQAIRTLHDRGQMSDSSWHNDVCPSFMFGDGSVRLFVDHPDPQRRECRGKRFFVSLYDESDDFLDNGIETDDIGELLTYLHDHWDIKP